MSRRVRVAVVIPEIGVVLGVLLWGYTGLPRFGETIGPYGQLINRVAQQQRHVTNLVSAVMFDYRGTDTLIEEFILFGSVIGVALLLRSAREPEGRRPSDVMSSDAVRVAGRALAPVLLLFGLWIIAFGYVTPGGGFQGGVAASGGALLLWLAGSYRKLRRFAPSMLLDVAEGVGAASYVGLGLMGLVAGGTFLSNTLPLGTAGTLASGGSVAALNWVCGIEVAAAFVLLYQEFLEEYIQIFDEVGR